MAFASSLGTAMISSTSERSNSGGDRLRHPVLLAAGRVLPFQLDEDVRAIERHDHHETNEGRVPNCAKNVRHTSSSPVRRDDWRRAGESGRGSGRPCLENAEEGAGPARGG